MKRLIIEEMLEGKTKKTRARFSLMVVSIMLIFTSAFIAWQLLSTEYPTHSDVFWTGVQCGALGILFLALFASGLFFLYRLAVRVSLQKRGGAFPSSWWRR